MKRIQMALAFVGLLSMGGLAYGYMFDFTNTLKGPVTVRVKLAGVNEPWYYAVIQGENNHERQNYIFNFQVGGIGALSQSTAMGSIPKVQSAIDKAVADGRFEYLGRKEGFCLAEVEVAPHVLTNGKWIYSKNFIKCEPVLVDVPSFDAMIAAVAAFTSNVARIAGNILIGIATGGVETAAAEAAGGFLTEAAAGGAATALTESTSNLISAGSWAVKKVTAQVKRTAINLLDPNKLYNYTVGNLVKAIGGLVAQSMCKDRSFRIVPNFDGNGNPVANPSVVVMGLAR